MIEHEERPNSSTCGKPKRKNFELESLSAEEELLLGEEFVNVPARLKIIIEDMINGEKYAQQFKNILLAGPDESYQARLAQAITIALKRKCLIIDTSTIATDEAIDNLNQIFS